MGKESWWPQHSTACVTHTHTPTSALSISKHAVWAGQGILSARVSSPDAMFTNWYDLC
jgi:hypothetical protein